jgi:hypothetical protein
MTNSHEQKNTHWRLLNFKSIAILCTSVVVILSLCLSRIYKNELKSCQTFQVFAQIDDIAHEQFAHMLKTWNPHNFTWSEEFLQIDKAYHYAETPGERLIQAIKMSAFIEKIDKWLHKIWALETEEEQIRDKRYHKINDAFQQLLKQ